MAEGIEFGDSGRPRVETMDDLIDEILGPEDDETTTPFVDIPPAGSTLIRNKEASLGSLTGDPLIAARRELLKTKVDAFLKVVADRDGLLPGPHVYDEFVLGEDGRTLYLKDGLKRVTWKTNSTRYRVLSSLGKTDFIRTHLFPEYTTARRARVTTQQISALQRVNESATAALQGVENIELVDLPQRVSGVSGAVATLAQQEASFTIDDSQLPMREILGLNEALKRTRGALVDNLAKLSQLDADITQAEQELGGEEAANDPEKKQRIQERLDQQRSERDVRLEAAAANREALRTQFSRIQETVERVLNEDTTLAERLRTLFREQGVTIASVLTALGFIVSTVVLAFQNMLGGGWPTPTPTPSGHDGATGWVKKQLKTLASWLKTLAEKAAAALPGIIGAIVSWLLKTAGSVSVWLAEHLWALAIALVAAAAVYMRDYRAIK